MEEEIKEEKITLAEEIINKLPYTGHIILTFVRVTPSMKLIHKKIPLQYLSKEYKLMYGDLEDAGIILRLNPGSVELFDYYKFICKLFPDFDVQDRQSDKVGKPDFFLINNKTEFYIEVKNGNDGIRSTQMSWVANNPDKEVWFLFIGGLRIEDEGQSRFYYEKP
jgi:hypothetical protein